MKYNKIKSPLLLLSSICFLTMPISVNATGLMDLIYNTPKKDKVNTAIEQEKQLQKFNSFPENEAIITEENNGLLKENTIKATNKNQLSILLLGDMLTTPIKNGLSRTIDFKENPIELIEASNYNAQLLNFSAKNIINDVNNILDYNNPNFVIIAIGYADVIKLDRELATISLFNNSWQKDYEQQLITLITPLLKRNIDFALVGTLPHPSKNANRIAKIINEITQKIAKKYNITFINMWNNFANDYGQFSEVGFTKEGKLTKLRYKNNADFTTEGEDKLAYYISEEITNKFFNKNKQKDNSLTNTHNNQIITAKTTNAGLWETNKSNLTSPIKTKQKDNLTQIAPFGRVDNSYITRNATKLAESDTSIPKITPSVLDENKQHIQKIDFLNGSENNLSTSEQNKLKLREVKPESDDYNKYDNESDQQIEDQRIKTNNRNQTTDKETKIEKTSIKETQKRFKKDLSTLPMNGLYY
ncbi:hypothetical protein [Bartonella sp. DGB1]|uniref:DUF459 domain-containing protein n=1 Tax=Bartonella sp. DGB1 TaxID=3239807 RepID=UPI003526804E